MGSIKPLGWLKDELELEADGLAGNLINFYRFVNDSAFIGGSSEYSALNEASPYWFNGLVPLAFGLGNARIESQVRYYLDYILDFQQEDGWIGSETTQATRGLWARALILRGLIVSPSVTMCMPSSAVLTFDAAICGGGPNSNGQDCRSHASICSSCPPNAEQ